MVPFYMFYSMFGYQRVGDLIWAAADMRGRGFLMGATAGRTTLLGEGSSTTTASRTLLFSVVPNVRPTTRPSPTRRPPSCETASGACTRGRRRGHLLYITLYNENYEMPPKPEGVDEGILRGILRGLYRFAPAPEGPASRRRRRCFLGAGQPGRPPGSPAPGRPARRRHRLGRDELQALREEALDVERYNRLHPAEPPPRM